MTIERRFVEEKIRELDAKTMLRKELDAAGYSGAQIKRTPMGTHIIIQAVRPGLVIGTGGENVNKLTKKLIELGLDSPHIEVQAIEKPDLDAKIVAWRIGKLLERGFYFKSVAMRTLEQVMRTGARGVEIRITGKVPSDRARSWSFKQGYVRHCGETAKEDVLYGKYTAMLKSGMLGIKVRIMPPGLTFPDEVILPEIEVPKIEEGRTIEASEEEEMPEEAILEEMKKMEPPDQKTKEEIARDKGKSKEEKTKKKAKKKTTKKKAEKKEVKKTTKKKKPKKTQKKTKKDEKKGEKK
jgi:small subunit ribosomal protein S3